VTGTARFLPPLAVTNGSAGLGSVSEISNALSPLLGAGAGRLVFSAGVPGGSHRVLAGAGLGGGGGRRLSAFPGIQAVRSKMVLWRLCGLRCWRRHPCLVRAGPHGVNIAAQVLNALLLPLVIGFLVALAVKALPASLRPHGVYLWVLIGMSAIVVAVGLFGGVSGLL